MVDASRPVCIVRTTGPTHNASHSPMYSPHDLVPRHSSLRGVATMVLFAISMDIFPDAAAQGSLSFFNGGTAAVGDNPVDMATGDFNRDGNPDLAVLNQNSESVSVLLGDGEGGLSAGPTLSVISGPRAVLIADLDRDSVDDIIVVNSTSQDVVVRRGLGNGTFSAATGFDMGVAGNSGVVADFNEDGKNDIVVVGLNGGVSLRAGDGNGSFGTSTPLTITNARRHVAAADFNRDGHLDLVFPAGTSQITVALGAGDGTFDMGTPSNTTDQPLELAPVDLNRDGRLDLAVATPEINKMVLLLGDGNGGFGAPSIPFTTQTNHVKVADFDRDGVSDLLLINYVNSRIDAKLGAGDGTLEVGVTRTSVENPVDIAVADFNRDGRPDYAVCTSDGTAAPDTAVILLNAHDLAGIPVNVSTRALVTTTASVIPGFVVEGAPMRVLVRAVGPGLEQFGVTNFLANPRLRIFSGSDEIFNNDDWSLESLNQADVSTVSSQVGAFPLAEGSLDAAIVVTLDPGQYTVVGAGEPGTTGEVLMEVYRADP